MQYRKLRKEYLEDQALKKLGRAAGTAYDDRVRADDAMIAGIKAKLDLSPEQMSKLTELLDAHDVAAAEEAEAKMEHLRHGKLKPVSAV